MSAYKRVQKVQLAATQIEEAARAKWLQTDDALEAAADMATERATRNYLSYDAEAFAEMVRDDLAR